jgi:hypothetical protein
MQIRISKQRNETCPPGQEKNGPSVHLHAVPLGEAVFTERSKGNRNAVPKESSDQAGQPEAASEQTRTCMLSPVWFWSCAGIVRLTRPSTVRIVTCSEPTGCPQATSGHTIAEMLAVIIDSCHPLRRHHTRKIAL